MEKKEKEVYVAPVLEESGLLRDITAHCHSGQIDILNNGCHSA